MDLVLTLIAGAAAQLDAAAVDRVGRALQRAGARTAAPDWLAPGRACDLPFDDLAPERAVAAASDAVARAPIDLAVLPAAGRRKSLLIADMDMTVITHETLDEIAVEAGIGERITAITRRAMNGEVDFGEALVQRVALLRGQPAQLLDRVLAATQVTRGAKSLVRTMSANGATCLLISGGFTHFTEVVAAAVGFHASEGNQLEVVDGTLTGRIIGRIVDRTRKVDVLEDWRTRLGLEPSQTAAVGDGANDLPMLLKAGLGVAYRAKPIVRRHAVAKIDHGDLAALLYMQGYRERDIVPDD